MSTSFSKQLNSFSNRLKNHNDKVAKGGRSLAIIHATLHVDVFISITNLETTQEAWDKLKEEFQVSEKLIE